MSNITMPSGFTDMGVTELEYSDGGMGDLSKQGLYTMAGGAQALIVGLAAGFMGAWAVGTQLAVLGGTAIVVGALMTAVGMQLDLTPGFSDNDS